MPSFVTLTYDLATRRTQVAEEGRPAWSAIEPDGILGACSTGGLFSRCGYTVTYRVVRSRVDAARVLR